MMFYLQEGVFQGLIPILNSYLENMEVDVDTRCTILNYLKLIKKRASGKLLVKDENEYSQEPKAASALSVTFRFADLKQVN